MRRNVLFIPASIITVVFILFIFVACDKQNYDIVDADQNNFTRASGDLVDHLGLPSITSIKVRNSQFEILCKKGHPEENFNTIQIGLSDKLEKYLSEDSYKVVGTQKMTSKTEYVFKIPITDVVNMNDFYFAVRHANINSGKNEYGLWNPYGSGIRLDEGHIVTSKPESSTVGIVLTVSFPIRNYLPSNYHYYSMEILFEAPEMLHIEHFSQKFDTHTRYLELTPQIPNSVITYKYRCLIETIGGDVYHAGEWTDANGISPGTFMTAINICVPDYFWH